jgi:crotonobetainyl-CoA:carnitine CoA-transferase CaiB-like acyl-CoA transferase
VQDITGALNGVTVTEKITGATPLWAALTIAFCGRLAADFGACVISVREPGDPISCLAGDHANALRAFLDAGKRAPGAETSAAASSLSRVTLRYDGAAGSGAGVKEVVFCGNGADAAESEFTIAATSGLLDIVGRSDARPLMLGGHQISYSTGLSGFLAAVALLRSEDLNRADVSALGTALWINWKSLAAAAQGRPIPRRSAESGKWRTAPCADGHVALVYFDRDWPVIGKMTGDPVMQALAAERAWTDRVTLVELEARLEAWALKHTRSDIAAASKSFGLAIGAVWSPAELLADPQYRAREFFGPAPDNATRTDRRPRLPVIAIAHDGPISASARTAAARGGGPLAGVRVIDLGILTAGASTSAILADLGADVIKVESPTYLDPFRGTPGTSRAEGWWNNSDAFKSTNRNKRGICLDLKSTTGREIFLQLAGRSDVVIENFRRGVMQRLGLGHDALRAANAGIILASVSSQGENGPDAGNISFGSTLEATSGLAAMTAYDDGVPLVTGMDLNYPDQVGSVFAASAVVAALRTTARTGTGAHLDISQRELATYLLGEELMAERVDGVGSRLGNASPEFLLQDAFKAQDGWVAVSIQDDIQLACALTLAASHLAGANSRDIEVCKNVLSAWTSGLMSRDACRMLRDRGIAAAQVLDGAGAWNHAREINTGTIRPLARSPSGDIVKGFPLDFPQRAITVNCAAPNLGEHTEAVLRDVLGLQPDQIAELARDNVIGTRPASPNASRLD